MLGEPSKILVNFTTAMNHLTSSWQFWALLAAAFAALTAIFAKVGVSEINPDVATFVRTVVILIGLGMVLSVTGQFRWPVQIPLKAWGFLVLSGLATGASWVCYFRALKLGDASQVAPVDKLSVVLVALLGLTFLGEQLSITGWVGVVFVAIGAALVAR